MLIGGESKGGKSTILANLIREMIQGGEFLGFKVLKPLRMLMMQAELRESRLQKRLQPKYSGLSQVHLENSYAWNTRGLIMIERDKSLIKDWLSKIKPDALVIDPIINFHDHEENDATAMAKFFRVIDELKAEFNMSIILSHHFRKSGGGAVQGSLLESVRGSSAFRGWMDTTIVMEGRTKTEYRRVEFETRNSDEAIKRIIKYNKATKEFDWHNPLEAVYEMLCTKMNGDKLSTTQVVNLILIHCGDLVSKNRTRAFDMKDLLISTKQLIPSEDGKTTYLELAK